MNKYEYTIGKEVDLKQEQQKTLQTPTLKMNLLMKVFVWMLDFLYGRERTLLKFKVLEILARQPYWAWENGSYYRITKNYATTHPAEIEKNQRSLRHIDLGRESQDNEQWHLMLIEDIMRQKGIKTGWVRGTFLPHLLACGYFFFSRFLYYIRPQWSFIFNASFESHAEHQYMLMVQEHPEWEEETVKSKYFQYYPKQKTLADLFRRIGLDERDHMNHSLEEYEQCYF